MFVIVIVIIFFFVFYIYRCICLGLFCLHLVVLVVSNQKGCSLRNSLIIILIISCRDVLSRLATAYSTLKM